MSDPTVTEDSTKRKDMSDEEETERRQRATEILQKHWKNKDNKATREFMNTEQRWNDAALHAKLNMERISANKNHNTPRQRWKRAGFFASRLNDGNKVMGDAGISQDETHADLKYLETQHWLELIDGKHRYGSNLKFYHRRWNESDTTDNFFRWLDHGEGKDLTLDECPREQLEAERIQYLSAEQRLNYLVKIDKKGKLRWAKNDELVDTSAGHWKDSGDGQGIVPDDVPEGQQPARRASFTSSLSSASSVAQHYAGDDHAGKNKISRTFHKYFTLRGSLTRLLRKTIKRNTWIYCTDKRFNLFIGIKETGNMQHSSFLSGGLVTSAGLISVKDGTVYTLSPLSGHYRTTVHHFDTFLHVLKERGVDMHKAKISKAYAALWGIEHLGKWTKAKNEFVGNRKQDIKDAAVKMRPTDKSEPEDPEWKKAVIYGRKGKGKVTEARSSGERPEEGKTVDVSAPQDKDDKPSNNDNDDGHDTSPVDDKDQTVSDQGQEPPASK